MAFCSSCGEKNLEDAKFCVSCGNELIKDESSKCPTCRNEVKPDTAFCPSCGTKIDPDIPKNKEIKQDASKPVPSTNDEILEVILIAGREKGKRLAQKRTMIIYKDFLIMAKGGSIAGGVIEGIGWAFGGAAGGTIGKSIESSMTGNAKSQKASTPQEILESDPDNIKLDHNTIKSIEMSYSSFKGAKIKIKTFKYEYKYNISEHKNYKKYVKSLKSIFGDKLIKS